MLFFFGLPSIRLVTPWAVRLIDLVVAIVVVIPGCECEVTLPSLEQAGSCRFSTLYSTVPLRMGSRSGPGQVLVGPRPGLIRRPGMLRALGDKPSLEYARA